MKTSLVSPHRVTPVGRLFGATSRSTVGVSGGEVTCHPDPYPHPSRLVVDSPRSFVRPPDRTPMSWWSSGPQV